MVAPVPDSMFDTWKLVVGNNHWLAVPVGRNKIGDQARHRMNRIIDQLGISYMALDAMDGNAGIQ